MNVIKTIKSWFVKEPEIDPLVAIMMGSVNIPPPDYRDIFMPEVISGNTLIEESSDDFEIINNIKHIKPGEFAPDGNPGPRTVQEINARNHLARKLNLNDDQVNILRYLLRDTDVNNLKGAKRL